MRPTSSTSAARPDERRHRGFAVVRSGQAAAIRVRQIDSRAASACGNVGCQAAPPSVGAGPCSTRRVTPDGIPVLLLSAFGTARSMWVAQQESLVDRGYRVIAVDLPGLSRRGESAFSMTSAGDGIADTRERHGRRPAHLVGISIGATLAVQVALDHPWRRRESHALGWTGIPPGITGRLERWAAWTTPERLLVGAVPRDIKKSHPRLGPPRDGRVNLRLSSCVSPRMKSQPSVSRGSGPRVAITAPVTPAARETRGTSRRSVMPEPRLSLTA